MGGTRGGGGSGLGFTETSSAGSDQRNILSVYFY